MDMGAMMGVLVLAIIPIIIFYAACQKYIIEGVVAGAVKVVEPETQKKTEKDGEHDESSRILLPISSLPSRYGIGSFSQSACEFVDQLKRAGQKYWQILPLGPTGYGDSPYQSFSAFAGNPYFIDLDTLAQEGLLEPEEFQECDFGSDHGNR